MATRAGLPLTILHQTDRQIHREIERRCGRPPGGGRSGGAELAGMSGEFYWDPS
jgi:hypothetical protein